MSVPLKTEYLEVWLRSIPAQNDLIIAGMDQLGFDSIWENGDRLIGYIPSKTYSKERLIEVLNSYNLGKNILLKVAPMEQKNWNDVWESEFSDIVIGDSLRIRAPFHEPDEAFKMEVIISPKMAFGTGHHQTTFLCANELLGLELEGKSVLDMGCGTGILSIICEKMGSRRVLAIDNDEKAVANSKENAELNQCSKIEIKFGDSGALIAENQSFDIVIANITKNQLLEDIPVYLNYLRHSGLLIVSGFLKEDVNSMVGFCRNLGLTPVNQGLRNNWACLSFKNL